MRTKIEPGVNLVLRAAYRLDAEGCVWKVLGNCCGKIISIFLSSFTVWKKGKIDELETEKFVIEKLGLTISHEYLHLAITQGEGIYVSLAMEEAVVTSVVDVFEDTS